MMTDELNLQLELVARKAQKEIATLFESYSAAMDTIESIRAEIP